MSPSMSNATHRPSGLTSTLIDVPSLVWKSSVRSKPRFFATSHLLSVLCCAGRLATDRVARGSAASRQSVRRMDGCGFRGYCRPANCVRRLTVLQLERAENSFLTQRRRDAENCLLPPKTPRTPRTTFTRGASRLRDTSIAVTLLKGV